MPPLFIAEVSSNHHRDLERCFAFIDTAAAIGCDAVKFQLFKLEELFSPEVLAAKPEVRKRKDWELPVAFLPALAARCRERGVRFGCTPFYLAAVDELLPHVDFFKVASYELLWDDLLRACAATGKPLVLSTGMATMEEITHAVEVVGKGIWEYGGVGVWAWRGEGAAVSADEPKRHDPRTLPAPTHPYPHTPIPRHPHTPIPPLTLLHCVSGYPTPVDQCNLAAIETLRQALAERSSITAHPSPSPDHRSPITDHAATPIPPYIPTPIPPPAVGWSDHSVNPDVILRAVQRWGATMIEFHLDLDGTGDEFKTGHCWLPEAMAAVIREVRQGGEGGSMGVWGYGGRGVDEGGAAMVCQATATLPTPAHNATPERPPHPHTPTPPYLPPLPMDGTGLKAPVPAELPDRDWRADPADGLRPLKPLRATLKAE